MKHKLGYVALFVVVFAVSAIVHLPASVVLKSVPLPSGLELQGVQGSWWQGSASQVRWQRSNLGALNWQLQWSSLLSAEAKVAVRFGRGSDLDVRGKGMVGYTFSGPFAEDMVVSAPAEKVVQSLHLPLPINATGQVELTLRDYRYGAPWCRAASGNLVWAQSAIQSPLGDLQLGPVMAEVGCEDNVLNVKGGQQSGQVSSEFSAQINANRRFTAQAWFKPGAEFPNSMAEQLKYLPRPDGQGRFQFSRQGQL